MKRHLFYTVLTTFASTIAVTLLGVTGTIHIVDGYLTPLVAAFLVEGAAAVYVLFRATKFFEDELRESKEVANAIAAADAKHRKEVFRIAKLYSEGKGAFIPECVLREEEERHASNAA